MKSKAWYIKLPSEVYANGPVRFDEAISEQEMRARARSWLKVNRLPVGTQVWPTKD